MADLIDEYRANNADALHDTGHARHAAAVEELSLLYQTRFPATEQGYTVPSDAFMAGVAPGTASVAPGAPAPVPAQFQPVARQGNPDALKAIEDHWTHCRLALTDSNHRGHAAAGEHLRLLHEEAYREPEAEQASTPKPEAKAERKADTPKRTTPLDRTDPDAMTQPAQTPDDFVFDGFADAPTMTKVEFEDGIREVEVVLDREAEDEVRGWMFDYGLTPAEGRQLEYFYINEMHDYGFTEARASQLYDMTERQMIGIYQDRWPEVRSAANRVFKESPEAMRHMLDATGLVNHPSIIEKFVRAAKQKGYFS